MTAELPDSLRREIIREVYRQAELLDWGALSNAERSARYDRWLDEAAIGGVLMRYVSRERARVWIKDVPMKHYSRACGGVGKYADLVSSRFPGPGGVAAQTFGDSWGVVEDSMRDKPNRCLISDGESKRLMIWGPTSNFRALIWAGLNAVVDGQPQPSIVVTIRQGECLDNSARHRHTLLGSHIGAEVYHTTLRHSAVPVSSTTTSSATDDA
jgi:hypothetical protein